MCEACAQSAPRTSPIVCANALPSAPRLRLRFPKAARLTGSREFARVKAGGQTWGGRFFVLSVLFHADEGPSRVGMITSRRVGPAVARARVRRLFREAVRPTRPELRPGCWIVLIARHPASRATHAEITAEWLRLGRRAGLLPAGGGIPERATGA